MNSEARIITPDGKVIDSLNESATKAKLMAAATTIDSAGETVTPDPATVYAVVDLADVDTHAWVIERRRAETTNKAKTEASARILALAPEWKQRNMIARGVELEKKDRLGTTTAAEDAEIAALESAWATIKAIRTSSDALEATIAASNDPASIDVTDDSHWS